MELAWVLHGKAVRFDDFIEFLSQADVVLVATSALTITAGPYGEGDERAKGNSKIMVIDVSFAIIEPQVSGVPEWNYSYRRPAREGGGEPPERRAEITTPGPPSPRAELLGKRIKEMKADEILARLYGKYSEIREREVQKALNRLASGSEPAEEVLRNLAQAMMKRFLADPTKVLKDACREGEIDIIEIMQEIFRLEGALDVSSK